MGFERQNTTTTGVVGGLEGNRVPQDGAYDDKHGDFSDPRGGLGLAECQRVSWWWANKKVGVG